MRKDLPPTPSSEEATSQTEVKSREELAGLWGQEVQGAIVA